MSELTNYNAAIYVRLSKEDEDASDGRKNESNSITNQKQLILDYLQDKPEINIVSVRHQGWDGQLRRCEGFVPLRPRVHQCRKVYRPSFSFLRRTLDSDQRQH